MEEVTEETNSAPEQPAPSQPESAPQPERLPPDDWACRKGLAQRVNGKLRPHHSYAGVKYAQHWVEGDLITEAQFERAMAEFAAKPMGKE